MFKSNLKLTIFCTVTTITPSLVHGATVTIGQYMLPKAFAVSLYQGMSVPVYIKFKGSEGHGKQKVANAQLQLVDSVMVVQNVELIDSIENAKLSEQTIKDLSGIEKAKFQNNTTLKISDEVTLTLDLSSFFLEMEVGRDAIAESTIKRSSFLGPSSVEHLSNVLNYNFGGFYNDYNNTTNSRGYLSLDNTLSFKEHHVNLNASFYGIGESNSSNKLQRAMYERDYEGRRFAIGVLDTWSIQSLASLSALTGGHFYGATLGNTGNTVSNNYSLSLNPITVFMSAPGQVYVYREGRLLSIQNFNMGSFEVDTSKFPYGIYDVDIEIVINGKKTNVLKNRVNKIFAKSRMDNVGDYSWQLYGGALNYQESKYTRRDVESKKKDTYLTGMAFTTTFGILSGLDVKMNNYVFAENYVNESSFLMNVNENISLGEQILLANDGSWRNISSLNFNLPAGLGTVWGSNEKSSIKEHLSLHDRDNQTIGTTLNLSRLVPNSGSLSISQTQSKYSGNKYQNVDYSNNIYSGRFASVGLRAGVQRYYYNNQNDDGRQEKYISLDFSLPLASWMSLGFSRDRYGSTQGNLTARKNFEDSFVRSASLGVSSKLSDNEGSPRNYSLYSSANYENKYNSGIVSYSKSGNNATNLNLTSQGSIGWTDKSFGLSKDRQKSGVIVNTGLNSGSKLTAKINNRNYKLSGDKNFISLPPYAKYKLEIMNDKNSEESFDIVRGRKQELTLYPGNVGMVVPEIKNMVTVFGRAKLTNGTLLSNTHINNHIGKTITNDSGEFALDIDKKYPVITISMENNRSCEIELDLTSAKGAAWVGDVQCDAIVSLANN